ncbi:hypothetical protein CSW98_02975 [Vibrio sp. HA2012]|uniref:hypothetical protein n=1 Tax=Vibrio sp. HA2012 TaxID=1971595 RepID=UPI000C2BCEC9|nr:hypothetical protein [Vibrio sp. HA2012]PJC88099.1 hypothetical protein CSW98_02975 [Vibrio sp. HA2012]
MKKLTLITLSCIFLPQVASAHTPLCSCYDFGDNTILCEGGFSDGSSASGVDMYVTDTSGKELLKGKIDDNGEFEFQKPSVDYSVQFNAGPGHIIEIDGKNIVE